MKVVLISFPEAMNHLASTDVLMVVYTAKNGPREQKEFFLLEILMVGIHFRTHTKNWIMENGSCISHQSRINLYSCLMDPN
uniref:Alternative protein GBE1 n=1 Tax=Homo sapiens TaxID=9606 RepID=L8E8B3_HUMAN|nr:alternative protein GBE1 [Homo sapiens]